MGPAHRSHGPGHVRVACGRLARTTARTAAQLGESPFSISLTSDACTQDLGVLAKHIPNTPVPEDRWHTSYWYRVRKAAEMGTEAALINKTAALFSHAYHMEWCYPKLKLVKAIWGEVLEERVARGWCEVETAVELVRAAFYENPARIYGGA